MYNMPVPLQYCQSCHSRQAAASSAYTIHGVFPVYLGGLPGYERAVIYSSQTGPSTIAQIQKYNDRENKWEIEYQTKAEGVPYFQVLNGYLEAAGLNVVVFYFTVGSGVFLDYTVVGRKDGKITELIKRSEIFQGDVWFQGGQLVEQYGNRYRTWKRRNGRLTLVPYRIPILPGALVIEYSISPEGKVRIPKTSYTVPPGSTVQLIRTDLNDISERVLYSYSPNIKYIRHGSGFKFADTGKMEITIIPGGYDWDKAVNLTVEAK